MLTLIPLLAVLTSREHDSAAKAFLRGGNISYCTRFVHANQFCLIKAQSLLSESECSGDSVSGRSVGLIKYPERQRIHANSVACESFLAA